MNQIYNNNEIEHYSFEWNDVTINIEFTRNYYPGFNLSHLVLKTSNNQPIPMTLTGYKSYFSHENLEADGTIVEYVQQWLKQEEDNWQWIEHLKQVRQPTLF